MDDEGGGGGRGRENIGEKGNRGERSFNLFKPI